MAVLPLQLNKETSAFKEDILLDVANKNWLSVLSGSSLKILTLFSAQHKGGEAVLGDYSLIGKRTGLAKGSVSSGLTELEAFGFIYSNKVINKKTKVYELNRNISALSEDWVNILENVKYKKFCIETLLGKKMNNTVIEEMQLVVVNSNEARIEKTLGRLLFLFVEKRGFTIEDLLEEERTKMQEDLFPEGFGFGTQGIKTENWQDILTDEEKRNKNLMETLEHYVSLVNYPTREDVDLIKKAMVVVFPYQIRIGITNAKNHARYGENFKTFKYIYNNVMNGRYGTRKNCNAKNKFSDNNNKGKRKPNNQTDFGFKTLPKSRQEIIDALDGVQLDETSNSSLGQNLDEEAFDFNILRT